MYGLKLNNVFFFRKFENSILLLFSYLLYIKLLDYIRDWDRNNFYCC